MKTGTKLKSKHTTGPWRVDSEQPGIVRINDDPTCGILVGQSANAHLVAAAPELLEACKLAFGMRGHNHWDSTMKHGAGCEMCIEQNKICEVIQGAIAKAEARR